MFEDFKENLKEQNHSEKPAYLSKMVDITDRTMELLGLETLKEKQDNEKRATGIEEKIAKQQALMEVAKLKI